MHLMVDKKKPADPDVLRARKERRLENEAEYKKLLNNEFMEALRDRTIKIDIPYITKVSEEIKIYEKLVRGQLVSA